MGNGIILTRDISYIFTEMYGGEERRGEEASFKEHFLARQIALLQSKAPNNLRLLPYRGKTRGKNHGKKPLGPSYRVGDSLCRIIFRLKDEQMQIPGAERNMFPQSFCCNPGRCRHKEHVFIPREARTENINSYIPAKGN